MLGRQLLILSQNKNALNLQSMMLQARKVEQGWASECASDKQSTYCSSLFTVREVRACGLPHSCLCVFFSCWCIIVSYQDWEVDYKDEDQD